MRNKATLLFLLFPFLVMAQQPDRFADIGNQVSAVRTDLLEAKEPALLPAIQLPFKIGGKERFAPMNHLDPQEELQIQLQKYRAKFAAFLKNYAPPKIETRINIDLEKFNWRNESDYDRKDFLSILKGNGVWEKIIISHYGPPLGKASTYYQTDFFATDSMLQKGAVFITFKAVDYKAHVFVNHTYIGTHREAFAPFEFEVSQNLIKGKNLLLVKVDNYYSMLSDVGDDGKKLDGDRIYAATGLGYDALLGRHMPAYFYGFTEDN